MGDAALQARLAPGDGLVHVARTGLAGGRASFEQLGFCYPLKLMPPRISAIDASIGKGVLCLYMLSYGGGLVSGDRVNLKITLDQACHIVLLTQGNTKVFRVKPGGSYIGVPSSISSDASVTTGRSDRMHRSITRQRMTVEIATGSSLFLLPAPVACFEKASYSQHQIFRLADVETSCLLLLDWFTSGRSARGEKWLFDRYRSRNEVIVEGRNVINDILLLEGEDISQRMSHFGCYCTMFICGKPLAAISQHFAKLSHDNTQYTRSLPNSLIWSYSQLDSNNTTAVVRCAGMETESVKEWLAQQLVSLQDLIGRDIYKAAFV